MPIRIEKINEVLETREPFFFSNIENFRKQAKGIQKPIACAKCPLHSAAFAVDDPPPMEGRTTDILCLFPFPYWADIQTSEEIPGWKKGSTQPNPALTGPFQTYNWKIYRDILNKYRSKTGLSIRTVYSTMCRAKGNPAANVTKYCAQNYLKYKLSHYRPKVILAFGQGSAKALGFTEHLKDLRGTIRPYENYGLSVPVIFTHDPSLYFFSKDEYWLLSTFILDFEKAISVSRQGHNPVNWNELRKKLNLLHSEREILDALEKLNADISLHLAFDIETTGLNPRADDAAVTVISFAWGPENALAYSLVNASDKVWAATKAILEGPHPKIAHNSKFDIGYLKGRTGIRVNNLIADTVLNAHLHDENRGGSDDSFTVKGEYTLKKLVWDYMWEYGGYEALGGVSSHLKKEGSTEGLNLDDLLFYAALDALVTWKLNRIQTRLLNDLPINTPVEDAQKAKKTGLYVYSRKFLPPVVDTLTDIENRGVLLDMPLLNNMTQKAEDLIKNTEAAFDEKAKELGEQVNIRSTKDLQYLLFKRLGLPIVKDTKTGNPSTDVESLKELADKHEIVPTIIEYRKVEKLLNTFLYGWKGLQQGGVIYPTFRVGVAKTGRLSCADPNLQQVPDKKKMIPGFDLKRLFIPRPGYSMIYADYSQQEVRVLASYCGEGRLLDALNQGLDLHSFTASQIYDIDYDTVLANKDVEPYASKRKIAKNVTFSMVYGGTEHTLADRYNVDIDEGKELIEKLYRKFPEIKKYVHESHANAARFKYVTSCFDRRRNFPILRWKRQDARAFRQAQNSRIQSTSADITVDAVVWLHKALAEISGAVLLTVHDSIIAEVPTDKLLRGVELFKYAMITRPTEAYTWLRAPLQIDMAIGKSWGDLEHISTDPADWASNIQNYLSK